MNTSFYSNLDSLLSTARDFYNRGDFKSSKIKFEACLEISADEPLLLFEYSCCLFHLKTYQECLVVLEKLLSLAPEHARGHSLMATILSDQGQKNEACLCHYKAIKLDPSLTQSAYGFAKTSSFEVGSEQYNYIKSLLEEPNLNINDEIRLYFSLAEMHCSNDDYEGQIKYLKQANELAKKCFPFNAAAQANNTRQIIDSFSRIDNYNLAKDGSSKATIFILGLPRSGSTLLEQMLASHSSIDGAGETDNLARAMGYLNQLTNNHLKLPEDINQVSDSNWKQTQQFFQQLFPKSTSKIIVEKQLFNFTLAGFAKLMNPDNIFVDLRRNPASQFISCYSILFGENRGFTHSIEGFIDAYRNQRKLIEFWKQQFPENIVSVFYESLVSEPESTLTTVLETVDCKFESGCLDFHLSKQIVTSASQLQVKQPIYTNSTDRWKNYQKYLINESELLQPLIDEYLQDLEKYENN